MRAAMSSYLLPAAVVLTLAVSALTLVFVARSDWRAVDRAGLWAMVVLFILVNPTHATPYLVVGAALSLFALLLPIFWIVVELHEEQQPAKTTSSRPWTKQVGVVLLVVFASYYTIGRTHHELAREALAAKDLRGTLEDLIDASHPRAVVLVDMPGFSFMQIDHDEDKLIFSIHDGALGPEEAKRARSFVHAHGGSTYVNEVTITENRTKDIESFTVHTRKDIDVAFQMASNILRDIYRVRTESIEVDFLPEGL